MNDSVDQVLVKQDVNLCSKRCPRKITRIAMLEDLMLCTTQADRSKSPGFESNCAPYNKNLANHALQQEFAQPFTTSDNASHVTLHHERWLFQEWLADLPLSACKPRSWDFPRYACAPPGLQSRMQIPFASITLPFSSLLDFALLPLPQPFACPLRIFPHAFDLSLDVNLTLPYFTFTLAGSSFAA